MYRATIGSQVTIGAQAVIQAHSTIRGAPPLVVILSEAKNLSSVLTPQQTDPSLRPE
jgi:hypothetical protein